MKKTEQQPNKSPNEALLRELVESFTQLPERIKIKASTNATPNTEVLTLEVAPIDYGKVYGERGKNAQALRTIFQFIGHKDGGTIYFLLREPAVDSRKGGGDYVPHPVARRAPNADKWGVEDASRLLDKVLKRALKKGFILETAAAEDQIWLGVHPDEGERALLDALLPFLHPIFRAIGKHHRRDLILEMPAKVPVGTE